MTYPNRGRPLAPSRARVFACALLAAALSQPAAHSRAVDEDVSASAPASLWTCGMHPEVVSHEPGLCPICGMELVRIDAPAASRSSGGPRKDAAERRVRYWVAPMDPSYISDSPGKSPMGMDLVPVYEDEHAAGSVVTIDPVVVQNMGVRLERVERQPLFRHIRTIGEVEVGEDLVSVVNLRFSGWVEAIYASRTGERIEAGAPLFDVYSPDLVSAQEEYLLARRAQGVDSTLTRSARRKLDLFGLAQRDIEQLERTGQARRVLPIRAPRSGHVLHKNVVEGARVSAGEDLYTIADLSEVWVKAEVYEHDAPWVEVGQKAEMELSYQRGRTIEGSVAYVYPTLNEMTRTLSVRLEFPNPDLRLKPGMFATVYIQFRRRDDVLVVPTQSILHSGTREIVFVSLGEGRFEPREITTGLVGDRRTTEVLSGLRAGEEVVASGQFLIDSESQLQEAIAKMLARRSGADDAEKGDDEEPTVWACPMHPEQMSHEPGRCPVCGMDLEERTATPEELERLRRGAAGAPSR